MDLCCCSNAHLPSGVLPRLIHLRSPQNERSRRIFNWFKRKAVGHGKQVGPANAARWSEAEQIYKDALQHYQAGQIEAAVDKFETARTIAHELGETDSEAAARRDMGVCYAALGQIDEALKAYKESLQLFRNIGENSGMTGVLHNMVLVFRSQKDWTSGISHLNELVSLYRKLGRSVDESAALSDLGAMLNEAQRPDEALEQLEQALAILRTLGMRREIAIALNNKSVAHRLRGETQLAKESHHESTKMFDEQAAMDARSR